jgi:hypothetical protein
LARARGLVAALVLALAGCASNEPSPPAIPKGGEGWRAIERTLPSSADARSSNICGRGAPACIDAVVAEMRRRLRPLDEGCDHNAPFALMYMRVTEGVGATGRRRFRSSKYLNHLDAVFAELYFRAYDAWREGRRESVPEAWQQAFSAADEREVTGIGDMLLGMNAHISRDLPFALAGAGLTAPDGRSGEGDFIGVNDLLGDVQGPLLSEAARRFDPTIAESTLPVLGVGASSLADLIARWRGAAWRDAERLLAADSAAARQRVRDSIERGAAGRGRLIALLGSNLVTGPDAEERDRYCSSRRG